MNLDMMGTYGVCGSVNEDIRQTREAEETARPKDTGPIPLTRPDRPGWWWVWSKGYMRWELECVGDPTVWHDGQWISADPPPPPQLPPLRVEFD